MRFLIISILVTILFFANLFFGAVNISPEEVTASLLGIGNLSDTVRFIVIESRLPQAITALLAGAGLAVAGLLMQTSFRNPLAGPSVLGISSGASLGVAIVSLLLGGTLSWGSLSWTGNAAIILGALVGSLSIMGILLLLSTRLKNHLMLLIVGMLTGYLTSSVVSLLSSMATAGSLQGFVFWGMGTFSNVSLSKLPIFSGLTLVGLAMALLLAKPLNILLLGDNYARNLGLNLNHVRNILLLSTGLLTAIITAYCGPVAFIGLAMPHVARLIFRSDNHWKLIPASMLCGAGVCLGCNLLSVIPDTVIPINALTPIVGVPVILYVILRRR